MWQVRQTMAWANTSIGEPSFYAARQDYCTNMLRNKSDCSSLLSIWSIWSRNWCFVRFLWYLLYSFGAELCVCDFVVDDKLKSCKWTWNWLGYSQYCAGLKEGVCSVHKADVWRRYSIKQLDKRSSVFFRFLSLLTKLNVWRNRGQWLCDPKAQI